MWGDKLSNLFDMEKIKLLEILSSLNEMSEKNYAEFIDEVFDKLCQKDDNNKNPLVITFEGIDATGKGTQSKMLQQLIGEVDHYYNVNQSSSRIQIPDYNTPFGHEIKRKLVMSSSEEILKSSREMALDFALNRREVQNNLEKSRKNIIIFDRWTNSSVAFTLAKQCLTDGIGINSLLFPDGDHTGYLYNKLLPLKSSIEYTEQNVLGLYKPDIEILLTADISIVKNRIKQRREQEKGIDIHTSDAHEENDSLLLFTQTVYKQVYETSQNKLGRIVIENDPSSNGIKDDGSRIIYLDRIVKKIAKLIDYDINDYKKDDDDDFYSIDKK